MSNKIYEIFNPNSNYNKKIEENLKRTKQRWIEEKCCFVCEHVNDISDDRNTCHLCKYTNDLLPNELTCLLWELQKEYKNES